MGTVAAQKLTEMIEGTLPSGEITYEIPIGLVQRTTTDLIKKTELNWRIGNPFGLLSTHNFNHFTKGR